MDDNGDGTHHRVHCKNCEDGVTAGHADAILAATPLRTVQLTTVPDLATLERLARTHGDLCRLDLLHAAYPNLREIVMPEATAETRRAGRALAEQLFPGPDQFRAITEALTDSFVALRDALTPLAVSFQESFRQMHSALARTFEALPEAERRRLMDDAARRAAETPPPRI